MKSTDDSVECGQEFECSICLKELHENPYVETQTWGFVHPCKHPFHATCIKRWMIEQNKTHMNTFNEEQEKLIHMNDQLDAIWMEFKDHVSKLKRMLDDLHSGERSPRAIIESMICTSLKEGGDGGDGGQGGQGGEGERFSILPHEEDFSDQPNEDSDLDEGYQHDDEASESWMTTAPPPPSSPAASAASAASTALVPPDSPTRSLSTSRVTPQSPQSPQSPPSPPSVPSVVPPRPPSPHSPHSPHSPTRMRRRELLPALMSHVSNVVSHMHQIDQETFTIDRTHRLIQHKTGLMVTILLDQIMQVFEQRATLHSLLRSQPCCPCCRTPIDEYLARQMPSDASNSHFATYHATWSKIVTHSCGNLRICERQPSRWLTNELIFDSSDTDEDAPKDTEQTYQTRAFELPREINEQTNQTTSINETPPQPPFRSRTLWIRCQDVSLRLKAYDELLKLYAVKTDNAVETTETSSSNKMLSTILYEMYDNKLKSSSDYNLMNDILRLLSTHLSTEAGFCICMSHDVANEVRFELRAALENGDGFIRC